MSVEIQIGAYILPNDNKIYKLFPGKRYKFYDLIRETSLAIVDVRDLNELGDDPMLWDSKDILTHIAKDRVSRSVAQGQAKPQLLVRSQGDKQTLTFLEGLFFTAKRGDLIMMPQKDYTSTVLVGRLLDAPGVLHTVAANDDDESHTYFGRRVEWFGKVEKRLLSRDLINLLHSPAAFFDIGRSHYDAVYPLAFDNFVYDKQFVATFRTGKTIFTPKDSFLTSVWLELLEVLEEARENSAELHDGTIFSLVINSNIDEDSRDDLSISVQSPGWFRIRSIAAAPLASLALFAMAVNGVPYADAIEATVSAEIMQGADGNCMGEVDAAVRDYIKLLGQERWEEACTLATQAEQFAKLSVDAKVRPAARKDGE